MSHTQSDLDSAKPLPVRERLEGARHGRIRRETRPEGGIGVAVESAAAEARTRSVRSVKAPPPTEEEAAILAEATHVPAQLFMKTLVADVATGDREGYTLVPDGEGEPSEGRVALGSPLGRALYREYPGAVVRVRAPGGERLLRLLRVEPPR